MKLTKNFRIKTQEGFTDVINFLSESVFFRDGRNLDTRIQDEVKALEQADAVEKKAREDEIVRVEGLITAEQKTRTDADNTLTANLNKEIQDRIDAVSGEKIAREQDVNSINTKIGDVEYAGDSLTAAIKVSQESINTINTTTIPGLQQSIDTINNTTFPSVQKRIDNVIDDIKETNDEIINIKKELNSTLNVLTEEQKSDIQKLMDKWKNDTNKNKFYYSGNIIMDKYAAGGKLDFINLKEFNENGESNPYYEKYELNCSTFVQFVMMGVAPEQLLAEDYNGYVKPAFDFGYAFNFKERTKVFGLLRNATSNDPKERYYGFRNPLNDTTDWKGTFSKNTYYTPSNKNITVASQAFNPFAYANDMAKELYELGCEIPYSALDIGDIVFSTSLDTDMNESIFDNVAWKKITHVFMVYGFANGEPIYIECTDQGKDYAPIATSCLGWEDENLDSSRMQASALTRKIVMCARNPAAFGITNFPLYEGDTKTEIKLTTIPKGVER